MTTHIRLNKLLAQLGIGSRRGCEQLAFDGRITVNNHKITQNVLINPYNDIIKIDNVIIPLNTKPIEQCYVYNKPIGEIVAYRSHINPLDTDQTYTTIYDNIVKNYNKLINNQRLIYCGRLDLQSSGLLLLTTSPSIATALTTNKSIKRVYNVVAKPMKSHIDISLNNIIPSYMLQHMSKKGITIDNIQYEPLHIRIDNINDNNKTIQYTITLNEGKNREIRRILNYFNLDVISLHRIQYGDIILSDNFQYGQLKKIELTDNMKQIVDEYKRKKQIHNDNNNKGTHVETADFAATPKHRKTKQKAMHQ